MTETVTKTTCGGGNPVCSPVIVTSVTEFITDVVTADTETGVFEPPPSSSKRFSKFR